MTTPATLSCKELVELVTEYLDGAMAEADRARFDEHLAICPPCVEYVAQIGRTIRTVGATWRDLEDSRQAAELLEVFRDWKKLVLRHAT
jgi:anti-sigma factor RsiW